jgi:hypothetical protein
MSNVTRTLPAQRFGNIDIDTGSANQAAERVSAKVNVPAQEHGRGQTRGWAQGTAAEQA